MSVTVMKMMSIDGRWCVRVGQEVFGEVVSRSGSSFTRLRGRGRAVTAAAAARAQVREQNRPARLYQYTLEVLAIRPHLAYQPDGHALRHNDCI